MAKLTVTTHNGDKPGPTLSLRYAPGINVEVGRVTRDYSKSPQAEVVIDADEALAPERSPASSEVGSGCYRAQVSRAVSIPATGVSKVQPGPT